MKKIKYQFPPVSDIILKMSSSTLISGSFNLTVGEVDLNFNSVPSGRGVLMGKAEKVIADYIRSVEEDEKKSEKVKKAVQIMLVINNMEHGGKNNK